MEPSARFALRWDGFKANAIDALCNLRGEREFFDVSLVADNGEQVGATKVVLAGGSDFFNKILKENPHPHPLIYMKGVSYEQLVYLLDFIYTGEARILQDDLNQFMDTAQDLKIKGLTLPTPAPRQGQAAAEKPGPSLGMLRDGVTSSCPEQTAPPSTISNPHAVQPAPYQSHVTTEEAPPPLATSLPRSLKSSSHQKHEGQVGSKIFSPYEGQLATQDCASAIRITAPHEGRVATTDHASSNPDFVATFPKSSCMEDHGGTHNFKVEVGDADLYNVYYGTNENGEAYISDVSKRVDAAISAPDEGQVDTEEHASSNCGIFHMEDHGDVGDAANINVYYGENNHGKECMKDVSKEVSAKVEGTGLCMEQEKNYQSVSAGKKVLVHQANDWYKLETKPSKKGSVNIEKMTISKYTEVSSKSRIFSENYDREKSPDKDIAMRTFDKKDMVDSNYDMIDIKVEDMSLMNEQPTHDWGQVNTTHGKQDPLSTKKFGTSSKLKRRERSHMGEKTYWYQCKVCHTKFQDLSHLKEHKRIHTGEKRFQCPVCPKKFSWLSSLKDHERIHTGEKPFQCEVCLKKFTMSNHLKVHKRIHTGEKPFQCPVCLKKFRHLSSFSQHKIVHTGEKLYSCELCTKKFAQPSHLKAHKYSHW